MTLFMRNAGKEYILYVIVKFQDLYNLALFKCRRGAVVKRVEHISTIVLFNI